ncbi:hypothetical protein KR222_000268 [Zaprionus bogoriensis]|nr:hypothetical protein KR222_000268 [Zaprionus bogoriensis]
MEGDDSNNMICVLNNMMSPNEDTVLKSTEQLSTSYSDSRSTVQLCTVLGNPKHPLDLRKCAGKILKSRLSAQESWQKLEADRQIDTQTELLAALKSLRADDEESLLSSVVRNVGYVMAHLQEEQTNEADDQQANSHWNEMIFAHIEALCVATERDAQALGALLFRLLVKTSPKMLEANLVRAQRIFQQGVQSAKEQGELAAPSTEQLLAGWSLTIPLFRKHSEQHKELAETLSNILCITHACAYRTNPRQSCRGFEVLVKLNKHMPEMVEPHLKQVMDELFLLAADAGVCDRYRVQAIDSIRSCVRAMRRQIIRLKLMDRLLLTLHGLLAVNPALDENGEELYLGGANEDEYCPLSEAVQTLLFIAAHSDTNRVAARALRLMQPQLEQNHSAEHRLAVQLFLALMAKGFTDLLSDQPLSRFLAAVERGFDDAESMVRRGAHYALAIMAENLQPEITQLVPRVLPLFIKFFDQLTEEQRFADKETETHSRMFCALEIYCESLRQEVLQPHLKELMQRLLLLAQPNSNSPGMRQLALSTICCLAKICKDLFGPHFDGVMDVALPLVRHSPDEDQLLLRTHAIQVINAVSVVNADKFAVQAPMLLECCMDIITNMSGAQVFTYELLGVLSGFVPELMNEHFPVIMDGLLGSIKQPATSEKSKTAEDTVPSDAVAVIEAVSADNEDTEKTDKTEDGHGDQTENDATSATSSTSSVASSTVLDGHDEALVCLKAFAINMPDAMKPYMPGLLEHVSNSTDQLKELDKWTAYETLTQLVLLQWRLGNHKEAKAQCIEMLPAMIYFVQTAKETVNVVSVMNSIQLLLLELKSEALEADGYADMVFDMLSRTLRRKLTCQFDIGVDTETDSFQEWSQALYAEQLVMEAAGNMLPVFGHALRKRQFASYFQVISSRFVKSLRQSHVNGQVSKTRFFLYNLTARCMEPLGVIAEQYYEILCYSIVDCILDQKPNVRQFAIDLFRWLLPHAIEREHTESVIKATSSVFLESLGGETPLSCVEREDVCGIIASMINADFKTVNLGEEQLARFLNPLPLRHKFAAYEHLVPALRVIYHQPDKDLLTDAYLARMVEALLESLEAQELNDKEDIRNMAIEVLQLIKSEHPAIYEDISQKFAQLLPVET